MTQTPSRLSVAISDLNDAVSLAESLEPRLAVERHFAELGHTYRHGALYRKVERFVTRPVLKIGLQAAGLYRRGMRNAMAPVVRRIALEFEGLPPALEGFEILHLSDFHIDTMPALADALAFILSDLEPDLCVFTGDYRFEDHGCCQAIYPQMRKIVSAIRARHGIFGTLGNHDAAEIAFGLEDMGVRMLVNESAEIRQGGASLWLAGVDDPFDYGCDDLPRALASVPRNAFTVLLAHAPEIFDEASQAGVSLYLSGHTHAGQIRLPAIGALRQNARCPRAYMFGQWQHGQMQGYTSAGVGCSSLPVRFGCPPEIALLELRSRPS
jgi:uncharacterized protein